MDLDDAYANAAYIEGSETLPGIWAKQAGEFRADLVRLGRADLDLRYGDSLRQRYDLFHPAGAAQGLMVFVHGGYWLDFDKSSWSHLAQGALNRGWAVAMPSYDLCPEVSIAQITVQVAHMIAAAADQVAGPMVLAGHSAGGHLVARMCVPGILPAPVAARVQRVMPISPVADLRPLLRTSMNQKFRMDLGEAEAESPVMMAPLPHIGVEVWVGAEERPAFLEQAASLAEAWERPCHIDPGKHHFNVIDGLADTGSAIMAHLLPSG